MTFIRYPILENPDDFEKMVCETFEIIWEHKIRGSLLNMEGKRGNNQRGSDIFGQDRDGNPIAIQVKLISGGPLTAKHVRRDLKKFQEHQMRALVKTYYIVTTGERNQTEQHEIYQLAERYGMKVEIVYYDWILNTLRSNPAIFKRYFPQFVLPVAVNFDETIKLTRPAISLAVQSQMLKYDAFNNNGAAWINNRPRIAEFIHTARCFLTEEQTEILQKRITHAWNALQTDHPLLDHKLYRQFADEIEVLIASLIKPVMRKNSTLERCWVIGLRLGVLIGEYKAVIWLKNNGMHYRRVHPLRRRRLVHRIETVFPNIPASLLADWARPRHNPAAHMYETLMEHLLWTNDLISDPDEPKAEIRADLS